MGSKLTLHMQANVRKAFNGNAGLENRKKGG